MCEVCEGGLPGNGRMPGWVRIGTPMTNGRTLTLAFLATALAARPASACKWERLSMAESIGQADLIFEGRPIARYRRAKSPLFSPGWDYVFVVERQWKGDARARHLVFSGYDSCSRVYARDKSYLIFAAHGATWKGMYPDAGKAGIVAALGPPTFVGEPPLLPAVTLDDVPDDFGWRETPPPDHAHEAKHAALALFGLALLLVPLLRARRR